MRIAIFTDTFIPKIDGVVTATTNLAKSLADRGHKIYIVAPKYDTKKELRHKNIVVKRIPSIPALFYPELKFTSFINFSVLNYIIKEKIDIIHFQTPLTLGLNAILIAKLLKIPLVGTFHTFAADKQYRKHMKVDYKFFEDISWGFLKLFYNRCDLVTCPSESAREKLLKYKLSGPIKVISNGIDFSIFSNKEWKKVKKRLNNKGNLLLFVGRIAHEKNIFYLIYCFKLVLKKLPKTKLIVIGNGPQMPELKEYIKEKGLEKNIILTGQIEHKDLVKSSIFKACDLFVTASTTETQGITTLEAQANGLACVGIHSPGIKDLIRHNYNGFLVKNNDKKAFANSILTALSSRKLLNKFRKNTLKEIRKHELESVIDKWEETYEWVLSHNTKNYRYNRIKKKH